MGKIDIDYYQSNYFTFNKPVQWKGLTLHPIKVKDWLEFASCCVVLDLNKNDTEDIEIIQMNYLKWLIIMSLTEDENGELSFGGYILPKLYRILVLCFNEEDIEVSLDEDYKAFVRIGKVILNPKDFDEFRVLVMYQNLSEYEEKKIIDSDLQQAIDDYNELATKNIEIPTLERQIVILANERHTMEETIFEMPYRKFKMALDEVVGKLDYQINKTAETSGMVTFKQPIDHWIYKAKKNKNAVVGAIDYETFKNKIQ